ncbi:MAG TPA: polysaccharide deacetylase family protein [Candidatus Saccharimonadia bacterium]
MKLFSRITAAGLLAVSLLLPINPASASTNIIANPSAETASAGQPTGWSQGQWGTGTATFSYLASGAQDGSHALGITMSGYQSGDAKWYFTPVAVSGSQQYAFSDYYHATVGTSVVVQSDDGSGNYTYLDLQTVPASSSWQQVSANFTAPANAKFITIFHLIAANGTLATDNFSLTNASSAVASGVPNPSVEANTGGQPNSWTKTVWGTNTHAFAYLNSGHTGTHSLKVTLSNYQSGTANWMYQPQPVVAGGHYLFTDWYQSNVATEVDIAVTMQDGSTQYLYMGSALKTVGWTKERLEYDMPAGAVSASVMHLLYSNGWLQTDDYAMSQYHPTGFSRGLVTVTLDDGFTNQYTNALPILQQNGLHGTFYIISGNLTSQPDYMTAAQVKALKAAGMEIGSHTVTHPDLTTLGATRLTNELKNSQTKLQSVLGSPVTDFASPYGTYDNRTVAAIQQYYASQRTTDPGYNSKDDLDIYRLRVQNITNTTTPAQVQAWINQAAADHTWLILVYHQVSTDPAAGEYNTTPADFTTEMTTVHNAGLANLTMAQALAEVTPQAGQ